MTAGPCNKLWHAAGCRHDRSCGRLCPHDHVNFTGVRFTASQESQVSCPEASQAPLRAPSSHAFREPFPRILSLSEESTQHHAAFAPVYFWNHWQGIFRHHEQSLIDEVSYPGYCENLGSLIFTDEAGLTTLGGKPAVAVRGSFFKRSMVSSHALCAV